MTVSFEREISLPADPFEAGVVFMAAMAYPEKDAGTLGRPGAEFADALVKFALWACSKARGLRYIREERRDPAYLAPKKREFRGTFDRGQRRIYRRIAAYDVYGTQLLNGFFAIRALGAKAIQEGRMEQTFHMNPTGGPSPAREELWLQAMPSARKIIAGSERRWSGKFGINATGVPSDAAQKSKDTYRRAFLPSVPVLHMVHALNECAQKHGPGIGGWGERDPISAMFLNSRIWIDDAIAIAERWRTAPHFSIGLGLKPTDMIALSRASSVGG